jgi:hypothetical protein
MMATMQTSFSRLLPPDNPASAEPPPIQQNHTFSTPPHLQNHTLSPIIEEQTPPSTAKPTNSAPFPPHLGKLTPDQLPVPPPPPSTQAVRQITHVTTMPAPITSSTPSTSTSTQQHYTQTTNPTTAPNAYSPPYPYTQFPPLPPPYYPYPPYFPPPPSPYSYPSPNYTHQSYPPHLHKPRHHSKLTTQPNTPTPTFELHMLSYQFSQEKPRAWILQCEDLFSLVGNVNDQ